MPYIVIKVILGFIFIASYSSKLLPPEFSGVAGSRACVGYLVHCHG